MVEQLNYVLMRFDGINLALPRDDVLGVESCSRILRKETEMPAVGVVALGSQELPVYLLSGRLKLLSGEQLNRRFCVCLDTSDSSERYALACDVVEQHSLLKDALVQTLPEFMQTLRSPIGGMFRAGDDLALTSTAEAMKRFVELGGDADG